MCFDADALRRWVERQREQEHDAAGPDRDAGQGLAPAAAEDVGADRRRPFDPVPPEAARLAQPAARRSTADRLYESVAPLLDIPQLEVAGFQYFTFNELSHLGVAPEKLGPAPATTEKRPVDSRAARGENFMRNRRRAGMTACNLQELPRRVGQHRRAAAQLADRRVRLPGRPVRVQQLAPRAARRGARPQSCSISRTTW